MYTGNTTQQQKINASGAIDISQLGRSKLMELRMKEGLEERRLLSKTTGVTILDGPPDTITEAYK